MKKHRLGPQNGPRSLGTEKTAKNSKLPTNYFEPVGIGGWLETISRVHETLNHTSSWNTLLCEKHYNITNIILIHQIFPLEGM
jgi:hypothetical protein